MKYTIHKNERPVYLQLYKQLRGEKKFESLEALREAVMKNREEAVAYFRKKNAEM